MKGNVKHSPFVESPDQTAHDDGVSIMPTGDTATALPIRDGINQMASSSLRMMSIAMRKAMIYTRCKRANEDNPSLSDPFINE
jgi:hypothetical protein